MKSKQDVLGIVANIALVVLLFCFIVAGLNIIGIYSLPEPVEKLLGTYDDQNKTVSVDDNILYNSVSFDENKSVFEPVNITYEDAKVMLIHAKPYDDYTQQVKVSRFAGSKQRDEILNISFTDGLYSVDFCNVSGKVLRNVTEKEDSVLITDLYAGSSQTAEINKGTFNINEECGFVLSAAELLNSDYDLSEGDFLCYETENGMCVNVRFENDDLGIAQTLNYTLSLDLGVVTQAECFENGILVYQMTTTALSSGM